MFNTVVKNKNNFLLKKIYYISSMKKILFTLILSIVSINLYSQTELDYLVLKKINEYRVSLNLKNLVFCEKSFLAAKHHTEYMVNEREVGHKENNTTPNPYDRLMKYYPNVSWKEVGENCTGTPFHGQNINELAEDIVNNWKTSPIHNEIMTDPDFIYCGVSCLEGTVKKYDGYPFMISTLILWY